MVAFAGGRRMSVGEAGGRQQIYEVREQQARQRVTDENNAQVPGGCAAESSAAITYTKRESNASRIYAAQRGALPNNDDRVDNAGGIYSDGGEQPAAAQHAGGGTVKRRAARAACWYAARRARARAAYRRARAGRTIQCAPQCGVFAHGAPGQRAARAGRKNTEEKARANHGEH